MTERFVAALHYRVNWDPMVDYENAPPLHDENASFIISLAGRKLEVEFTPPVSSEVEARKLVDEYLEAWDVLIGLENHPGDVHFHYEGAAFVALDAQTGELRPIPTARAEITCTSRVTPHIKRGAYPPPPEAFRATPTTRILFERYSAFARGEEKLPAMAYSCLTALEKSTGAIKNKRQEAGRKYRISDEVLRRLGELSARRGDEEEARKAPKDPQTSYAPLHPHEKKWLIEVVKAMIRRTGECGANPAERLPLLTMSDFPDLPSTRD